jgi:hypothetical protein
MIGFIAVAVSAAVLFAADWLTEEDVRRRQRTIRDTRQRLQVALVEIRKVERQASLERGQREYLRRKALIAYRTAQKELLEIGLDALNDAKSAAFTKLKVVDDRILKRSGLARTFIDKKLFDRYHVLKAEVHETIAESKVLTTGLVQRLRGVKDELKVLKDSTTHSRRGGKRKVEELLEEFHSEGRQLLARRNAKGSTLRLGQRSYVLELRCVGCRAYLSPAMAYCPSCGDQHGGREPVRYLEKEAEEEHSCPECQAPTTPELRYCFNCGEKQDPFGLQSVL